VAKKEYSLETLVPLEDIYSNINWDHYFNPKLPFNIEIGFGVGEFLLRSAIDNPKENFLGIEKEWDRIYKAITRIERQKKEHLSANKDSNGFLKNIRIVKMDAEVVFCRLIKPKTIDNITCLFPCPWPKKKHVKFRLFSKRFLKLLNNRLKNNGSIKIVTDFVPYYDWILEEVQGAAFNVSKETIKPQFNTKFENKWCNEGQEKFYKIDLLKKRHLSYKEQEQKKLKSYKIKNFNPAEFNFTDEKGAISIIFKDMLFDAIKKQAMVQLIVSEQHLTQHFRVIITKEDNVWNICKAAGQMFFPTKGIALAMQKVYEAAKKSAL